MDEQEQIEFLESEVERMDGAISALKSMCALLLSERAKETNDPERFILSLSKFSFLRDEGGPDDIWKESAIKTIQDLEKFALTILQADKHLN